MTERGRSGNPLWIAYETVAMVIGLGSLALICLGWLPFALLLQPLLPQRWAQPIGRGFITRASASTCAFSKSSAPAASTCRNSTACAIRGR
jgi:hypothetical protein